jgi:hypothetical protein
VTTIPSSFPTHHLNTYGREGCKDKPGAGELNYEPSGYKWRFNVTPSILPKSPQKVDGYITFMITDGGATMNS